MNAPRWRGWLAAIAIFVLGAATGGAGMTWVGIRVVRRALAAPASAPGLADRAAAQIGADLAKSLELTPEQAARVQAILDTSAARLKDIRVNAARNAAAEVRTSTAQIAAELPAEKRAALYRVMARRFERFGGRAPPPEPTSP